MIALICTIVASGAAIYITERLVRTFRRQPTPPPLPTRLVEPPKPVPQVVEEPPIDEYLTPKERYKRTRPSSHDPKHKSPDDLNNIHLGSGSAFTPITGLRR